MYKNKTITNILGVFASNVIGVIAGIITGLLLPKLLSVEDYGYLKTFSLYISYVGLFTIGFMDGISLEYGDKNLDELNKSLFRTYFRVLVIFLLAESAIVFSFGLINNSHYYGTICMLISINIITINIAGYFQHISQITRRFKEYSLRVILKNVFSILAVGILYLLIKGNQSVTYITYALMICITNFILCLWYVFTYKDYVFGQKESISAVGTNLLHLVKIGYPLLLSNLCTTLILAIDRQFVSVLFNKIEYAIYSFAYSILALVTVATSAISTVIYPSLKRASQSEIIKKYSIFASYVMIFVSGALLVYYPLNLFIVAFLPKYLNSMVIFRIIFPGLVVDSTITVIMHNYYKSLGKSNLFFKISAIALLFSFTSNVVAYLLFRTTVAISVASIISLILWYLLCDSYLCKTYKIKNWRNLIYLLAIMTSFYVATSIANLWIGLVAYFACYTVITLLIQYITIRNLFNKILNRSKAIH